MKNWNTLEPDRVKLLNKHFTPGRGGKTIKYVVIHHNAGMLSIDQIWDVWQTRQASAHYQVTAIGEIGQLVWDRDTAWHAADLTRNQESIGVEHANIGGASADWPISTATLEEGAHLVAALCKFYRLGRPQWGKNVRPHSETGQTSCPYHLGPNGKYGKSYIARAQHWYDRMTTPTPTEQDDDMTPEQERLLKDNNNLLRTIAAQLCGAGNDFGGWPQGGNRTLYDLTAATAAKSGVTGARDVKDGARP